MELVSFNYGTFCATTNVGACIYFQNENYHNIAPFIGENEQGYWYSWGASMDSLHGLKEKSYDSLVIFASIEEANYHIENLLKQYESSKGLITIFPERSFSFEDFSYGTTVTLGETVVNIGCLLNSNKVVKSYFLDENQRWGTNGWEKGSNGYVYAVNKNKAACFVYDYIDFNGEESSSFYWLFPNKTKWIPLGEKRSYELLCQLGGTIPTWLEEKIQGFPTKGEGWALIN